MTRHETYNRGLWLMLFLLVVVVWLVMHLSGCGGSSGKEPDVPKLLSCAEKIVRIVSETPDCRQVARKVDELLMVQAECFSALTGETAVYWSCGDGGLAP